MKHKASPKDVERLVDEDGFLVSKTDVKGIIKYANRSFIKISGFTEGELLGANHNIVRHRDMPRSVFALLWERLNDKQEIFAYVKNMCKDGAFYWVLANVTPSLDTKGNVVGYYSVRRRPRRDAIEKVTRLYRSLLAEEGKHAKRKEAVQKGRALLNQVLHEEGVSYDKFILSI